MKRLLKIVLLPIVLLTMISLTPSAWAEPENNPPICDHAWSAPYPVTGICHEPGWHIPSVNINVKPDTPIEIARATSYENVWTFNERIYSKCGAKTSDLNFMDLGDWISTPNNGVSISSLEHDRAITASFSNEGNYILTPQGGSDCDREINVHVFYDDDDDGLSNSDELTIYNTDPNDSDSDDDGLSDGDEIFVYFTDPNNNDSDNDGLSDRDEVLIHNTNPNDLDSDADGISDIVEIEAGLNPNNPDDASDDKDNDGLSNLEEYNLGTNPARPDTDGDGFSDYDEVNVHHINPNNIDSDGDGLDDGYEIQHNWDPLDSANALEDDDEDGISNLDEYINLDSDNDGLTNRQELELGLSPYCWDTDGDLLSDSWETLYGLDPKSPNDSSADSDNDGLTDFEEFIYNTNPNAVDTDGDGTSDGDEVAQGSDPTDSSDGGQAPSEDKKVEIRLTVGDYSGSHSERWNLNVGHITHCAAGFGVVSQNTFKIFRIGKSYEVSIKWVATKNNAFDYDYTASISKVTLPVNSAMYIVDPNSILGTYGDVNINTLQGQTAYMHLVGQASIKNAANAKDLTDEDSLSNKIVIHLKASELIRPDVELVLCKDNAVVSGSGNDCIATLLSDTEITNYGLTKPTDGKLYAFDVTKTVENEVEIIKVQDIPLTDGLGEYKVKFRFKNDASHELHGDIDVGIGDANIVVDFNHDREIDSTDASLMRSKGAFHFWINDDSDDGDKDISEGNDDVPGALTGYWEMDGRDPNLKVG